MTRRAVNPERFIAAKRREIWFAYLDAIEGQDMTNTDKVRVDALILSMAETEFLASAAIPGSAH